MFNKSPRIPYTLLMTNCCTHKDDEKIRSNTRNIVMTYSIKLHDFLTFFSSICAM